MQWFDIGDIDVIGRRTSNGAAITTPYMAPKVASDYQHMTDAIYVSNGAEVSGGGRLHGFQFYDCANGLRAISTKTNMQGFNLSDFNIVEVGNAVVQKNVTDGPGLTVNDGHMNVFDNGIVLDHVPDSVFGNLLIYKNPLSKVDVIGFSVQNSDYISISNIVMKNETASYKASRGFIAARWISSSYGSIYLAIERPSIGVSLEGMSSDVTGTVKIMGKLKDANTLAIQKNSSASSDIEIR